MRRRGFTLDVSPLFGGVVLLTIAVIEMQPNYSAPAILWLAPALLILADALARALPGRVDVGKACGLAAASKTAGGAKAHPGGAFRTPAQGR